MKITKEIKKVSIDLASKYKQNISKFVESMKKAMIINRKHIKSVYKINE